MQENMDRMLGFVLKHYRQDAFDSETKAESRKVRRFPIWRYAAAFTAVAAAVLLFVFLFHSGPSVSEYMAADSSIQAELPDGSSVILRPGARVRYSESKGGRNVEMEGTALFKVARDESRPFKVDAGESVVEVLGTVFQVKQSAGDVYVDVLEGKVLFAGSEDGVILTPGMESVLREGTSVPKAVENALPNPIAWATGIFKYEGTPLETVLAELSGYFGREFIVSPDAEGKTLTGSFSTEDPETIAEAISAALEIVVSVK